MRTHTHDADSAKASVAVDADRGWPRADLKTSLQGAASLLLLLSHDADVAKVFWRLRRVGLRHDVSSREEARTKVDPEEEPAEQGARNVDAEPKGVLEHPSRDALAVVRVRPLSPAVTSKNASRARGDTANRSLHVQQFTMRRVKLLHNKCEGTPTLRRMQWSPILYRWAAPRGVRSKGRAGARGAFVCRLPSGGRLQ